MANDRIPILSTMLGLMSGCATQSGMYRSQIVAVDVAAIATIAVPIAYAPKGEHPDVILEADLLWVPAGAFVVSAPLVHLAHEEFSAAILSFGMRGALAARGESQTTSKPALFRQLCVAKLRNTRGIAAVRRLDLTKNHTLLLAVHFHHGLLVLGTRRLGNSCESLEGGMGCVMLTVALTFLGPIAVASLDAIYLADGNVDNSMTTSPIQHNWTF